MERLVLKIRRGTQTIGTWSLDGEPLEMLIEDAATGKVLGRFSASGAETGDALPLPEPCRVEGDDLTMPLPEMTNSLALPLLELEEGGDASGDLTREFIVRAEERRRAADRILNRSDDISASDMYLADALPAGGEPTEWTNALTRHRYSRVSDNGGASRPPAEVWLRRTGEWHALEPLCPGYRIEAGGGWVELAASGRLVVSTGPNLVGTVNRTDGSSYDLSSGTARTTLDLGASVILRRGDVGLYVRGRVNDGPRTSRSTEEDSR